MNHEIRQRIEDRYGRHRSSSEKGRILAGLFVLVIGGLWLAKASGVYFPGWFFTWPMILIAIGIFSGIRHGFRNFGWLIPLVIGGIFLADKISPDFTLRPYFWPIIIIAIGLFIIIRPGRRNRSRWQDDTEDRPGPQPLTGGENAHFDRGSADRNDIIDVSSIFGGIKKIVLSKNFRGGDIVSFMGGTEIDLTQADFKDRATIDCFNMFGGTKLIVPADWNVQSEIVAIFGGVDDKRPPSANVDPTKVLYLDGTCIFGGVEIRSYK